MPSMKGGNHRFRQHVSKNDESWLHTDPEKLDFDVPSRAKTQLPLFQIYWKCHQLGTQMGFKLVRVGASETRKLAKVGFGKHNKKRHQKSTGICSNMLQKEGPKKLFFHGI